MEKEKKSISKIILHVLEYILLAFIIFLIVFVILKSCEKNVNALSSSDSYLQDSININDFGDNTDCAIYYFDISDKRPLSSTYYNIININNNGNLIGGIDIAYGNNYHVLGVGSTFHLGKTFNLSSSLQYVLAFVFYKSNNNFCFDYYLISIDSQNGYSIVGASETYVFGQNYTNLDINILSSFWLSCAFTNYDVNDMLNIFEATLSTNYIYQTEEYKQDHIFGNVVSSFLNIQFGQFAIGNTTYSLTLGMLLLFIIGLGALFIIIKVFLGG